MKHELKMLGLDDISVKLEAFVKQYQNYLIRENYYFCVVDDVVTIGLPQLETYIDLFEENGQININIAKFTNGSNGRIISEEEFVNYFPRGG
jgi:hypothetical protein